jgi:hypothetical protein
VEHGDIVYSLDFDYAGHRRFVVDATIAMTKKGDVIIRGFETSKMPVIDGNAQYDEIVHPNAIKTYRWELLESYLIVDSVYTFESEVNKLT